MTEISKKIDRLSYLSHSKFILWEKDKNLFYQTYVLGLDSYRNKYMELGKRMAKTLENGYDEERDPGFESVAIFMPGYKKREFKMKCEMENIPLVGILDGFDEDKLVIGEYKTGKKFTQGMVNSHTQLTFYALMCWKIYGKLPSKIFLHHAETIEDMEGNLSLTGKLRTFETKRTMADIILFFGRLKKAWVGIKEMESEMKSQPNEQTL